MVPGNVFISSFMTVIVDNGWTNIDSNRLTLCNTTTFHNTFTGSSFNQLYSNVYSKYSRPIYRFFHLSSADNRLVNVYWYTSNVSLFSCVYVLMIVQLHYYRRTLGVCMWNGVPYNLSYDNKAFGSKKNSNKEPMLCTKWLNHFKITKELSNWEESF